MAANLQVVNNENQNGQSTAQMEPYRSNDLDLTSAAPKQILEQAALAAAALKDVVEKKTKKVVFNGEQYLEFADWQMIARFYGSTVESLDSKYVEYGDVRGFEARAIVLKNGVKISAAEAMCLDDERNWANKPLFQLKSMAQTRACAKALRNVFSGVVELAGYKATPAEEMQEVFDKPSIKVERKSASKPSNLQEKTEEKRGPYWTYTTDKGEKYLCVKASLVFDEEFLIKLGMRQSKKNPDIYTAKHSMELEEKLALHLQDCESTPPVFDVYQGEVMNA